MELVRALSSLLSDTFKCIPLSTSSVQSGLFLSHLPTEVLYAYLLSPIWTKCLAHLILFDLIALIIFGEEYKSWSSFLCSLLQPPATSSILGLSSWVPYSRNPLAYILPLMWDHVLYP